MPDADINIHPDLIELVDGDVTISRIVTVLGKLVAQNGLEVFNSVGELVFDINESTGNGTFNKVLSVFGKLIARAGFEVRTTGGTQAVDVDASSGTAQFRETVNADGRINVGTSGSTGEVLVKDSNNDLRIDLNGNGSVEVRRSDGSLAAKIYEYGLELFDANGNRTIDLSSTGTHDVYENMVFNSCDIKHDGYYLSSRLDDFEARISTLEGYH